jgi:hypothetical protein
MTIDKTIVYKRDVNKINDCRQNATYQMTLGKMTADEMTPQEKILDKMTVDEMPCCRLFLQNA